MERKKAIEIVRKNFPDSSFTMLCEALKTLIPELIEIEDEKIRKEILEDEKIRKEILDYFKDLDEHGYPTKEWTAWVEKQGKQKSKDKYTFNSIPRLLEMIKPTDRAKRYCQKLIDSLQQEGYVTDAKIISKCLKRMNGEKVSIVTMDEKQGEPESNNKVEQKFETMFKVGNWIVTNDGITTNNGTNTFLITNINCGYDSLGENMIYRHYCSLEDTEGVVHYPCLLSENLYHPWTINDAKDGDVVVDKSNGIIGIFQSIGHHTDGGSYNDPSYCFLHCRYDDGFFYADFENGNMIDSDNLIPATKEQRNTLFVKMKEAGYEWNVNKKEIVSISKDK